MDLPLSTLTFAPKLNLASTAEAGAKLTVPLSVDGYAAGNGVGVKSLEVKASYDGGKTWVKAPVTTEGTDRVRPRSHRPGSGGVSRTHVRTYASATAAPASAPAPAARSPPSPCRPG